jgi:hypothetical protein
MSIFGMGIPIVAGRLSLADCRWPIVAGQSTEHNDDHGVDEGGSGMKLFSMALALLVAVSPCLAGGAPPAAKAMSDYQALVVRAKAGDASVDYGALRRAYTGEPGYSGYGGIDKQAAFGALQAGKNDEALKLAEAALADCYADIDAHIVAASANRALGRQQQADAEAVIARGLIGSIAAGGDGKSARTAYHVITVREEYVMLGIAGLRPAGQSLRNDGGIFDVLAVEDLATGAKSEIWFDISSFFGRGLPH